MENDPVHLKDFVKRWKDKAEEPHPYGKSTRTVMKRYASFPELYKNDDGEFLGIIDPESGEKIEAPWSAYLLALMEYGYSHLDTGRTFLSGVTEFNPPGPGPAGFPEAKSILVETCKPRWGGDYYFQTLSSTLEGEYRSIKDDIYTPCYIAAMQQGMRLRDWDNEVSDIYPDRTEEKLAALREEMGDFPEMVYEGDWKRGSESNPMRGYSVYYKNVRFADELTSDQLGTYQHYLYLNKCPGWTGVSMNRRYVTEDNENSYTFRTVNDSSG